MSCLCSHSKSSMNITSDLNFKEAYGNGFENRQNFVSNQNSDDEQDNCQDDVLSRDENICKDMIFIDGNDRDLEICEYEETLMERVWWSCNPPKIPKSTHAVPARRIQVMTERLSPTVPGLPTPKDPPSQEVTKNGNRRHKIKSDINYVAINDFDEEKKASCQTQTVTIIPDCARRLEEYL